MKVEVQLFPDQFNVLLSTKEGVQPFLTIRGCRVVEGRNGRFVSWPARKTEKGFWNHCLASDSFAAHVLEVYDAAAPKQPTRQVAEMADDLPPF